MDNGVKNFRGETKCIITCTFYLLKSLYFYIILIGGNRNMFLEIKENNNSSVSFRLLEGITYIVASSKIRKQFLLKLAGINPSTTIYYNGQLAFDNREYFKKRVFLDAKNEYLKTLNVEFINSALQGYGLSIDNVRFKKAIKEYNVRNNAKYTSFYQFPIQNNTLLNIALAKSLNNEIVIIDNPLFDLDEKLIQDVIIDLKKANKIFVLGLDSFEGIKETSDKVIVISDHFELYCLMPETELIVIDEFAAIRNKIFIVKGKAVCLNDYSKDELKEFAKKKIKVKQVTFSDWLKQNKGVKL